MRKLIAERLNVVPAGIGNSESEINMNSFVMGDGGETQNEQTSTDVDVDEDNLEDDDGSGKGTTKSMNKSVTETSWKTGTRPGTSKPATCTPKERTKKRKVTDFVELAGAEEMTRQKELKVAKARAEVDKAKLEARKAETAYKTQKLADKAAKRKERAKEKAMKLQLLVLHQQQGSSTSGYGGLTFSSLSTPFTPQHMSVPAFSCQQITNETPTTSSGAQQVPPNNRYYWDASPGYFGNQSTGPSTPSFGTGISSCEASIPFSQVEDDSPFSVFLPKPQE